MQAHHLNLLFLRYFVDAIECGSVSKAADKNAVTVPAVSQGLRRLEQDLNVSLTTRQKKRFEPTSEGLAFFLRAKEILKTVDSVLNEGSQKSQAVRIGCSSSLFKKFVAPRLERWRGPVKVKFGTSAVLREMLSDDQIDVAIMVDDGFNQKQRQEVLFHGRFVLLGKKGSLSRGLILTEDRPEVIDLRRRLSSLGVAPKTDGMRVESWSACYHLAQLGAGVCYVPDYFDRRNLTTFFSKKVNFPYQIVAVYGPGARVPWGLNQ